MVSSSYRSYFTFNAPGIGDLVAVRVEGYDGWKMQTRLTS